MLKVVLSNGIIRDLRMAKRRGQDLKLFQNVVNMLARGETLPRRYFDHRLGGNYGEFENAISNRIGC